MGHGWFCFAVKGCLIFQCTNEVAANIFTCLVIQHCGIDCVWQPVQNISLEGVQALVGSRCHLSLLQKVLGETLPALPSLLDESMIPCLVLCVVDTAILVLLSAGERNMHSVGRYVLHLQAF